MGGRKYIINKRACKDKILLLTTNTERKIVVILLLFNFYILFELDLTITYTHGIASVSPSSPGSHGLICGLLFLVESTGTGIVGTNSINCSSLDTSSIHEETNVIDNISRYFIPPKVHIIIPFLLSLPDNLNCIIMTKPPYKNCYDG